jgi:cytochrome c biogenesis protein CcmG/thiol:disulfide interchange protein DsbE
LTFTFTLLALLSTPGVLSCSSSNSVPTTETGNATNANTTTVKTTTSNSGNMTVTTTAPANSAAPPSNNQAATAMLTPLPAGILSAPLKTIDGKPFKLSDAKGKVMLLDLWATWCGPCRLEVPHLVELQKEFGPRGLEIFGLDIDPESDTTEAVREFMDQYKVNYKVAFLERQYASALMAGNGSIPQSYVITRDGKIYKRFVGFSPSQTPPQLRTAIEEALNTKE